MYNSLFVQHNKNWSNFSSVFRKKKFKRTKTETRYDEDDPEAYKDMPVPDKVTNTMFSF